MPDTVSPRAFLRRVPRSARGEDAVFISGQAWRYRVLRHITAERRRAPKWRGEGEPCYSWTRHLGSVSREKSEEYAQRCWHPKRNPKLSRAIALTTLIPGGRKC